MNRLSLALALTVLVSTVGWSQDYPDPHQLRAILDGRPVRITLESYHRDAESTETKLHLVVKTKDGAVLWTSPHHAPFDFSEYDAGAWTFQLAGDIDGDGRTEVVLQTPQSDVRAETFRMYRWQSGGLAFVREGNLVENPRGSGRFTYHNGNVAEGLWIDSFKQVTAGRIIASVTQIVDSGRGPYLAGLAEFQSDARGFHLIRWVHRLAPRT